MNFAEALRALMDERGVSGNALARTVPCDKALISRLVNGKQQPSRGMAQILDHMLEAGGMLAHRADRPTPATTGPGDEITALELIRCATATDAGDATVGHLEQAVDGLAVAYAATGPAELLGRVKAHLGFMARLLDGRTTLAEHRRLLVSGGWLSLLAATCLIDLGSRSAASAYLRTAAQLARETGHPEISAWCLETHAWQLLTSGDYKGAARVAQGAQAVAPRTGSAYIQSTAQEGRAWARLAAAPEAYDALARTQTLVASLAEPDRPEHHYRYDPAKSEAYVATTLSWLGDPAAERYARHVLTRLETGNGGPPRARRAASARLDLALALTNTSQLDEAAATRLHAVTSGLLVPSNYWHAAEIITVIDRRGLPETRDLREAYGEYCRDTSLAQPPG